MTGNDEQSPQRPDLARVLAEIDEEVRAKRASGELTPEFERELDLAFARYAPVDAVQGDFDVIVAKLEESTTIDTRASTLSSRPGVAQVKRVVAKAIDWDLRHLASQVSGLSHALIRAVRLLGDRVDALELDSPAAAERAVAAVLRAAGEAAVSGAGPAVSGAGPAVSGAGVGVSGAGPDPGERRAELFGLADGQWDRVLVEALIPAGGRVLHTASGDGRFLERLRHAGVDAYGVESDEELALVASERGLDVRCDDARSHLRRLPVNSLGGVVLSGVVERLSAGAQLDLADLAASRLARGGVLAVVSAHPRAWARHVSPVLADLAPGRPMHPRTWVAVLASKGLTVGAVHEGPEEEGLSLLAGAGSDGAGAGGGGGSAGGGGAGGGGASDVLNANIAKLNDLLFGPTAFAVLATR